MWTRIGKEKDSRPKNMSLNYARLRVCRYISIAAAAKEGNTAMCPKTIPSPRTEKLSKENECMYGRNPSKQDWKTRGQEGLGTRQTKCRDDAKLVIPAH